MSQVLELAPPSLSFMLTSTQLQLLINQLRLELARIGAGSYVGQRKLEKMQSYILM
jgi:hypothetical protein